MAVALGGCVPGYVKASELERRDQGPSACAKSCEELKMRMVAMVLVGDTLPGCVCQVLEVQSAGPEPAPAPAPAVPGTVPAPANPPPGSAPAAGSPLSDAANQGAAASTAGFVVIAAAAAAQEQQRQQQQQQQLQQK
jgi:hypothetical protein